jgi:hypothetical protein
MVLKEQHEGLRMMDCFNMMAPSDEELLGLALDDMPLQAGAQEHLKHCSICQQRLARYRHTNSYLLTKLYRSQCPTPTQLNHYCAGLLPADEETGITYHIAECPLCTRETISIRSVFAAFEPFPFVEERLPGTVIKRILATLVPWQPQLVMRGDSSAARWPRQYSAGAINVSLHLSRGSSGENILLGLFSSENPDETVERLEGIPVDLYCASGASQGSDRERAPGEEPVLSTQIDDLGNIVFKGVPVGEYVMIVRLPDSELVIEGLLIEH